MIEALQQAGVEVCAVERNELSARSVDRFDADFVLAPNMNYILGGMIGDKAPVTRIGRPTSMLWDDPLGALALYSVWKRNGRLGWLNETANGDELECFRALMSAPGIQHFAWDSGHVDAVLELGLTLRESITFHDYPTYRPFFEQGYRHNQEPELDLSFCGNIYENLVAESNFSRDPFFADLTERLVSRKLARLSASMWDVFCSEVDRLDACERNQRGLIPTRSEFWDYYLYAVWLVANTRVRIGLMTQIEHPVDVFGMFGDPESRELLSRYPTLRFVGDRHGYAELPATYAATRVNLCISNGLIYEGLPVKFLECVASGGFALVDFKADLLGLLGEDVRAVMFDNADELNRKIEYFLARPGERREIVETLRPLIERRCTAATMMSLVADRRRGDRAREARTSAL